MKVLNVIQFIYLCIQIIISYSQDQQLQQSEESNSDITIQGIDQQYTEEQEILDNENNNNIQETQHNININLQKNSTESAIKQQTLNQNGQIDFIQFEIEELEKTVKLYQNKIQLLNNLRENLQQQNITHSIIDKNQLEQIISDSSDNSQRISSQKQRQLKNQKKQKAQKKLKENDNNNNKKIQEENIESSQKNDKNENFEIEISNEADHQNIQILQDNNSLQNEENLDQIDDINEDYEDNLDLNQNSKKSSKQSKKNSGKLPKKQTIQQRQFMNKVLKKVQFDIDVEIVDIQILNSFQYQTIHDTTSNQMIIIVSADNLIYIYDITGFQIVETYNPKHEIKKLSLNPRSDEVIVTTLGYDNIIKIARIEKRKIKVTLPYEDTDIVQPKGKRGKTRERYRFPLKMDTEFPLDQGKFEEMFPENLDEEEEMIFVDKSGIPIKDQDGEYQKYLQIQNFNATLQDGTGGDINDLDINKILEKEPRYIFQKKPEKPEITLQKKDILQSYSYSTLSYVIVKGNKYFVLGDIEGNIHSYHRNGTFKGMQNVSNLPIQNVQKLTSSNTMYSTRQSFGFFNPAGNEVIPPYCDIINEGIQSIRFDQNYNNYIYVLTFQQQIIVYEIKNSDKSCKFKHTFQTNFNTYDDDLDFEQKIQLEIMSIRNSLIVLDKPNNLIKIFNTTEINSEDTFMPDHGFLIQIEERKLAPNALEISNQFQLDSEVFYGVNKVNGFVSYMVFGETLNGKAHISLFEITTPQKKDNDFLNNLRWPIVIVAMSAAFGWQYWNKKKSGKGEYSQDDVSKIEKMLEKSGIGKELKKEKASSSSYPKKRSSDREKDRDRDNKDRDYRDSRKEKESSYDGYSSSTSYNKDKQPTKSILKTKNYGGSSNITDEDNYTSSTSYDRKSHQQKQQQQQQQKPQTKEEKDKINLEKLNKYKDTLNELNMKSMGLGTSLDKLAEEKYSKYNQEKNVNSDINTKNADIYDDID